MDENASVEAKKTSVEAKKAKAKKERRKSLSDMCKVSGELQRKIETEREFCLVLWLTLNLFLQDSSGKLTNDYWSKLQSRFKVDDDEEEDKEKEMQKEEEDINKIYETSIAKKEIDVEEKVLWWESNRSISQLLL